MMTLAELQKLFASLTEFQQQQLHRALDMVEKAERERCAKLVEAPLEGHEIQARNEDLAGGDSGRIRYQIQRMKDLARQIRNGSSP